MSVITLELANAVIAGALSKARGLDL